RAYLGDPPLASAQASQHHPEHVCRVHPPRAGGRGLRPGGRDSRWTGGVTVATTTRASTAIASCRKVSVVYRSGETRVEALTGIDLEIHEDDHLALLGRSGSGKTTLLHVLGGLVIPTSGTVT